MSAQKILLTASVMASLLMACSSPVEPPGNGSGVSVRPAPAIVNPELLLYNKHGEVQCKFIVEPGQKDIIRLEHEDRPECPVHRWDVWKWEIRNIPAGSEFTFMQDDRCGYNEDVVEMWVVKADMTRTYRIGPYPFAPPSPWLTEWTYEDPDGVAEIQLKVENESDELEWFWCVEYRIASLGKSSTP